jgi:hypothetical protein
MKVYQTVIPSFSYISNISEINGEYKFLFVNEKGKSITFSFTEENFFEQFLATDREKTDSMNIYIVPTEQGVKLVNKYAESYYTNAPGGLFIRVLGYDIVGQIYIPFADSPISDWAVRINSVTPLSPQGNIEFHETPIPNTEQGFNDIASHLLPGLRLVNLSLQDDETYDCEIQLTYQGQDLAKSGVDICAKSISGYIPVRQISSDQDGKSKFKIRRLDLEPSDEMTATFGFKLRTSVIDVDIPS